MIFTTMPQYSHTENPHNRFGIDTHRLRFAIRLPSASQKASSSVSQCCGVAAMYFVGELGDGEVKNLGIGV